MKYLSSISSLSITFFIFLLSANTNYAQYVSAYNAYGTVKSVAERKTYGSVRIGDQTWMTENLDLSSFRNGDLIKEAATEKEWEEAGQESRPAWCYADNSNANGKKYGKLYNWFAVNDPRGLSPTGWHVPSDAEWTKLANYLGGKESAGSKMKAAAGWEQFYNGTNTSGFTALPGGYCDYTGESDNVGSTAYFWSATESNSEDFYAYYRLIRNTGLAREDGGTPQGNGLSVRCIRD